MPDQLVIETGRELLAIDPALAAFCFFLIVALIWREKRYYDKQRELTALQEKRLEDVKAYAAIGETVREQMRTMVQVVEQTLEFLKDRRQP